MLRTLKKSPRVWRSDSTTRRRGAMIVLIAAAVVVLLVVAMFSVDVAYMLLVRTQLRAATDAATKAGTEALQRTQSTSQATAAVIDIAARNQVAGRPLVLSASNLTFGNATPNVNGTWGFTPGGARTSAIKVDVQFGNNTANGPVGLFFGGALGTGFFQPNETATASVIEQDILFCIDRSHSMCFDLSGVDWRYPTGTPTYPDEICYPPHATLSRWAALASAANSFMTIADGNWPKPRIALTTWASTIGTNTYEYRMTRQTSPQTTNDTNFSTDYTATRSALAARGTNVILGGTNAAAGLDASISRLNALTDRPLSQKTVIFMTDGQWNQGRDPILSAQDAAAAGIVIHCITFLPGAQQQTMVNVATTTGGKHYYASNAAELTAAFQELARTLPVVLTE